jgi:hypothetical protein
VLSRMPRKVLFFYHKFQRRRSGTPGLRIAWLYWAMMIEGTNCAASKHAFLHDADAFFVDRDSLERQYADCRDRGMMTLGVEKRGDAFFSANGYAIPGTWETMYSVHWARSRSPLALKGELRDTPHGRHEFDAMLYAQYLDYNSGKIGVMAPPPRVVHFHGTIGRYRGYNEQRNGSVADNHFRLLLLSMLQELVPEDLGTRNLPTPRELARGLDNPTAPVRYDSQSAADEFPIFRRQIDELMQAPVFTGERATRVRGYIAPFDDYFASRPPGQRRSAEPWTLR